MSAKAKRMFVGIVQVVTREDEVESDVDVWESKGGSVKDGKNPRVILFWKSISVHFTLVTDPA